MSGCEGITVRKASTAGNQTDGNDLYDCLRKGYVDLGNCDGGYRVRHVRARWSILSVRVRHHLSWSHQKISGRGRFYLYLKEHIAHHALRALSGGGGGGGG